MKDTCHTSEVARLLDQIETEYIAAQRGLDGFAEVASHQHTSARMENLGRIHQQLQSLAGEEGTRLFIERLEGIPEETCTVSSAEPS